MLLTESNLREHLSASFPAYASGDVDAVEFNKIVAEQKKIQDYVIRNWNLYGAANPLDYYDGVYNGEDITIALQAAVNSPYRNITFLPILPTGQHYRISGTIVVPTGKLIMGPFAGAFEYVHTIDLGASTVYAIDPSYPMIHITGGLGCSGFGISAGVTFNGDYTGILIEKGSFNSDGYIRDMWFVRTKVVAKQLQGWSLADNVFDAAYGSMMELYNAENCRILDNRMCIPGYVAANSHGLLLDAHNAVPSRGNIVVGNIFDSGASPDAGGYGGDATGLTLKNARGNTISANTLSFNTRGMKLSGATCIDNVITGNTFSSNGSESILIDGASKLILSSNNFDQDHRVGNHETNVPHIKTLNTCSKIMIDVVNMDSSVRTTGVELSAGTTKSCVDKLMCSGTITTGVSDLNGTNTVGTVII